MNLYEILEVSESASMETINKIYKIQAKKYHPDLQTNESDKLKAEEKMKQINDAYSVLSDELKRKEYDQKLENERILKKQEEEQKIINNVTKNYANSQNINNTVNNAAIKPNYTYTSKNTVNNQSNRRKYTEKDYIRDYNKKLRKFRVQLFWNKVKENLKALTIMCLIIIFIWFFPPTHKVIINLYEENILLQTLVGIIKKLFVAIKETIFG